MADERISSFITPEAMAELTAAVTSLKDIASQIATLNTTAKQAEGVSKQAKNIEELAKASQTLVDVNGQLILKTAQLTDTQKQYLNLKSQLNGTTDTMIAGAEALAKQRREELKLEAEIIRLQREEQTTRERTARAVTAESNARAAANREAQSAIRLQQQQEQVAARAARNAQVAADSYEAMNRQLNALRTSYNRLSAAERDNVAVGGAMLNSIRELDAQLRASDANMGVFRRNVGNYSSATAGLRLGIQQIARELPSLSGGFAIFASAIGNNIAGAADAIRAFRAEQAALRAQGQATQSMFSALGGAILNWQTALLIGVTLLTVYAKDIAQFSKELFTSVKAQDAATLSLKAYTDALKDTSISNAAAEFEHMQQNIKLAKEGVISKEQALKIYNDTLGDTVGNAKDLNQAEQLMLDKKVFYLQMIKDKAVATALWAEAGKKVAESALMTQRIQAGDTDFIDKLLDFMEFGGLSATGAFNANKRVKAMDEEVSTLHELAAAYDAAAAQVAKAGGLDVLGGAGRDKTKAPKATDLIGRLNRLRGEIQEFAIKLASPSKEELDDLTKEIQAQLDIASGKIEFDVFDKESEERAKAAAKRLEDILRAHGEQKLKDQKDFEERRKRIIAQAEGLLQASTQLSGELAGLSQTLSQRRIQELDAEIKKINEKRDADINAINARGLSEEETRKAIARVNIEADAQQRRIEQEKIQRQRRAAAFDKAVTIGQIISQTALAVIKAYTEGDPYTKVARSILAAAAGAVALAKAAATPLPAYEEGTKGVPHKGGPARLFEGNRTEAVIENGKVWFGNQEGIYNLAKGAQVLSQDQLIKLTQQYAVGLPALIPVSGGLGMDTGGLEREMRSVRQAIEGKPTPHVSIGTGGLEQVVLAGNHTLRYALNIRNGRA